jgi:hypothetical protein
LKTTNFVMQGAIMDLTTANSHARRYIGIDTAVLNYQGAERDSLTRFRGMFFGLIRLIWHFYTPGGGSFAFKSSFSYLIFRFSCQAVVSLICEWSWAIRISAATVISPYWEPKAAPMEMLFWRNNIEAGHTPSPGLFTTIRSSFYMFKIWCHFS